MRQHLMMCSQAFYHPHYSPQVNSCQIQSYAKGITRKNRLQFTVCLCLLSGCYCVMLHLHVHKAMNSVKYGSVLMSSGFSRYISEDTYFSLCKHTLEIISLLLKCNYYQPGNCMLYHQAIIHIFPVITKRCIMSIIFHFCCLIIVFFYTFVFV